MSIDGKGYKPLSFKKEKRLTKQYFKDECDINNVVKRFQETGFVPVTRGEPQYGDAPNLDFKEALDLVMSARQEFNDLEHAVQALFDFNESNYYSFLDGYSRNPAPYDALVGAAEDARSSDEGAPSSGQSGENSPKSETPVKSDT